MTLHIRQLFPADAAAYRELMLEGYAAHPEAFTASVAEREEQPLSWWEARTAQVLGAFEGGELVGAAGLERDDRDKTRHRAKLFAMYVGRKARRRGVGRALALAVLDKARRSPGLEVVYLTVMEGNTPARRLYAACGFAEFGREPMAVYESGDYLAKVHMWHRLHPGSEAPARPRAPELLRSARLEYRRPRPEDLDAVRARYAADPEVTRYLSWPTHTSPAATRFFFELSESQWTAGPAGPFLLVAEGTLIGSTGLDFQTPYRATTGYVLAKDAWGRGYATEALKTMVALARELGAKRVESLCHAEHQASARVLEKGGLRREGLFRGHTIFPNLDPETPADVLFFGLTFD